MIITAIRFNKDQAIKYGLKESIIGKPGYDDFSDHYAILISKGTVLINGAESIEYNDVPSSKAIINIILKAITKMIQSGDFINEKSQILTTLFDNTNLN